MRIFIAGICGTFMGSLAQLLQAAGDTVYGCDKGIYPPMSDRLAQQGITVLEGYDPKHLSPKPDIVLIGNALSRGNPIVEAVLEQNIPYASGPGYLAQRVLKHKEVIAVTGTHGKTTTTTLLSWILECNGDNPSFLIGGVPHNFAQSARLTDSKYFVIEGDEYDTAFFDKRPKMLVYEPDHIIINNLEFDHADIYETLEAIQKQFHYLVRLIAPQNHIVAINKPTVDTVLKKGMWSCLHRFGDFVLTKNGFTAFGEEFTWNILGAHNAHNACAAITMARNLGVPMPVIKEALQTFKAVKRRLELIKTTQNCDYYDDFAHHPTAIKETFDALKHKYAQVAAVCDLRSNSMRLGVYKELLADALSQYNPLCVLADKDLTWDPRAFMPAHATIVHAPEDVNWGAQGAPALVTLSNGGLSGVYRKALEKI